PLSRGLLTSEPEMGECCTSYGGRSPNLGRHNRLALDAGDQLRRLAAGYREMRRMPRAGDKQRIGGPDKYARRLPLSTRFASRPTLSWIIWGSCNCKENSR